MSKRWVRRTRVATGGLLLVAPSAACSGSSSAPASGSRSGSAHGSPSGTPVPTGGQRPVTVRVPSGYRTGSPAPLLVLLHGYTSDATAVDDYFHLQPVLDERGVLYVVPNGTPDRAGDQFWNATDAGCDLYHSGVDDSGYLQDVIHQAQDRYSVDPRRIFVVGHSNGGFMAYRMACDHSDTVAAIVSVAGAMYDDAKKCSAAQPVSVLQVHGTSDRTVPYQGGTIDGIKVPGAMTTVVDWATFDVARRRRQCRTPRRRHGRRREHAAPVVASYPEPRPARRPSTSTARGAARSSYGPRRRRACSGFRRRIRARPGRLPPRTSEALTLTDTRPDRPHHSGASAPRLSSSRAARRAGLPRATPSRPRPDAGLGSAGCGRPTVYGEPPHSSRLPCWGGS